MNNYLYVLLLSIFSQPFQAIASEEKNPSQLYKNSVYLRLKIKGTKKLLTAGCSGVLVKQDLVLTTAHCFEPYKGKNIVPHIIEVKNHFGKVIFESKIKAYQTHPSYGRSDGFYKDLAWLKLTTHFPKKNVFPEVEKNHLENQTKLFFHGYSSGIGKLFKAKKIKPLEEGLAVYDNGREDPEDFLIMSDGESYARPGDSGGPLYAYHNKKWKLLGLILENSSLFTKNIATTFVRLSPHILWIERSARVKL